MIFIRPLAHSLGVPARAEQGDEGMERRTASASRGDARLGGSDGGVVTLTEPVVLKRPQRVRSPAFMAWLAWQREHPCPECEGRRVPCATCNGSRIDPAYAVLEET